ncbi:MAG: PilZ domain-containing protein [Treponema sp.]|jgi:L-rhamnose mutarotase|nr:PilZ domain-containing protein [Treponema sp.]
MAQSDSELTGKKIFILHPHSVIQDEMLDILIMAGFESYTVHDDKRAIKLLIRFPGSIMFVNIDEGHSEQEWESYIRGVQESPKTRDSKLGILSYNTDQKLMQKYLMDIAVPCGYIQLKLGIKESTRIMLTALEANEARGRRKFIRANCGDDANATVNIKGAGGVYYGKILDISASGIAARFDKVEEYAPNTPVREVQLKLRGSLVLVNTTFMGKRADNVCVLLFDAKMDQGQKLVVHRFIKYTLQRSMDNLAI